MYRGTVRKVSRQDIKLVTVSQEMEDQVPKYDLYRECFFGSEYISCLNADKKPLHDVLSFRKEIRGTIVDIALQWCSDAYSETILGYANRIRTIDGGTHIDGVKASLTRTLNRLAKKSKVVKDNNITLSGEHVREGLTCIVSVTVPNPEFEGQTQTRLGNPYIREIVDRSVQEYLTEYFELHPDVLERIISKSLNAYKDDLAVMKAKELVRSKTVSKPCTIPEKLTNRTSEKSGVNNILEPSDHWFYGPALYPWWVYRKLLGRSLFSLHHHEYCTMVDMYHTHEIVIGEGDSSGGAAKHILDRRFQTKRTREQPRRDDAVSTAPGNCLENTSVLSFERKRRKPDFFVPASHASFSSRQTADASKPRNPKGVRDKTHKDIANGSIKTKPVVPIGPGFQAEIPVWIAPTKKGKFYGSPGDSKTLSWLGTGVWPTYSLKKKVHYKKVGEGRSDSCSCASPKSTDCIKQHIKEALEFLEKEIGHAFYSWKFDQIGEVVSKSWTAKDEQRFEALVKDNPLSTSKGFWKFASKAFPRKSEKDLISYYHNVFLINRMRLLANTSADHIDSDDDQNDDFLAG